MGKWGPVTPMLKMSLDGVDDANEREHQGFLEVLWQAHPLLEVEVLIDGVFDSNDSIP